MHASVVVALASALAALPVHDDPRGRRDPQRRNAHPGIVRVVRQHSAGTTSGDAPPGMVPIPAGSFRMGVAMQDALALAAGDNARWADDIVAMAPQHLELVDAFFLDRFEVTNDQFARWLAAAGREPSDFQKGIYRPELEKGSLKIATLPLDEGPRPVRAVTFEEARECARWLGKRIPTETEWEFAARRGRSETSFYPWGEGWSAWSASRCAGFDSSTRVLGPPRTSAGGSFKDDVTVDGAFDVCGNVSEWTSSPFLPYPGFAPQTVKDRFGKRVTKTEFGSELLAVRGGCMLGNGVSNSVVYRSGQAPDSAAEAVGFRGAVSMVPGLDALRDAVDRLAPTSSKLRDTIDLGPSSIAAQVVYTGDERSGLAEATRSVAFARVRALVGLLEDLRIRTRDRPAAVGVLALAQPSLDPPLSAGHYLVSFKGRGLTAEQEAELAKLKRHRNPAQGSGRTDVSAEDEKPRGLLSIPADVDALVFSNRRGEFCGWTPANLTEEGALYASRLAVDAGSQDRVGVTFSVKTGNRGQQPQFAPVFAFPQGTFEPTGPK
jgi:formylglycine-generating enzyme required for sulfatase activity